jgi:hypothetical protein
MVSKEWQTKSFVQYTELVRICPTCVLVLALHFVRFHFSPWIIIIVEHGYRVARILISNQYGHVNTGRKPRMSDR